MEHSHREANSSLATHEIACIVLNLQADYHVHNSPTRNPILSQMNEVHALQSSFFNMYFNILPSMPRSSEWSLSLDSPTKTTYKFLICPIYVTCLTTLSSSI